MQLLFDFLPVIAFFVAYKLADIYVATAVLIAAVLVQSAIQWVRKRSLNTMHLVSAGLVLVFGGLFFLLQGWSGLSRTASPIPAGFDTISALGDALVSPDAYVLPFEVASVLLVAALIGAVYVAFNPRSGDSRK